MMEKRSAGVLLHITSLPSPYGMGDMGPEAEKFADFLTRSGQRCWQILPLTPAGREQGFSPYSPASSMAGNIWLISPDLLVRDGLLKPQDVKGKQLRATDRADFDKALALKRDLFEKAYENFHSKKQVAFDSFCERESYWLDEFALYIVLKDQFRKPWYQWPDEYRRRDAKKLRVLTQEHEAHIRKIKWLQFIFTQQWKGLKSYCNKQKIRIIGDLPFYVCHDSADAWTNPEVFALNKDGTMDGVAGVPPDYFNASGQLWGMPVYRWDVLKKKGYRWWINRIRKNLEMTDVLRLDHFRAFSEYWQVPATDKTAINGKWKPGPGEAFFSVLKQELGKLPFIAEDLGDISESVYKLRDQFNLPGMKVIQFAVGDTMSQSDHTPHNYSENFVAYTGTHDNNTTKGWFRKELKTHNRQQLEKYEGVRVSEKNVHEVLSRMAYASVAKTVILPLQDILGLDEKARMNTPASIKNNWGWRLKPGQLTKKEEKVLKGWCEMYRR